MLITAKNPFFHLIDGLLPQDLCNLLLVLLVQLALGELDVEGDVHVAEEVVVLVVGHPLALLAHARPGPGDLVPDDVHLVAVQVGNILEKEKTGGILF